MTICFVVACLLAICSIFAGFGPAYVLETALGNGSSTMFDHMFGTDGGIQRSPALTWLFCCELIIILAVVAIVVLYFVLNDKKQKNNLVVLGSLGLSFLSLAGGVTAFCTMNILGINATSTTYASVKMGAGAIVTGIMLLLAFCGFIAYVVLAFLKKSKKSGK